MSKISIHALANSYSEGKISRQAFRSLYAAMAAETFPERNFERFQSASIFQKLFRQLYYYSVIVAGLIVAYFALQLISPIVFSSHSYEYIDLPKDVRKAAETLSMTPNWHPDNIAEFNANWSAHSQEQKQEFQKSDWYKGFELALIIQQTQQKMLMHNGNTEALETLKALDGFALSKEILANSIKETAVEKS